MKVLIVEDNAAMRHLLRHVIGEMAEVYECADGAEALPQYEAAGTKALAAGRLIVAAAGNYSIRPLLTKPVASPACAN